MSRTPISDAALRRITAAREDVIYLLFGQPLMWHPLRARARRIALGPPPARVWPGDLGLYLEDLKAKDLRSVVKRVAPGFDPAEPGETGLIGPMMLAEAFHANVVAIEAEHDRNAAIDVYFGPYLGDGLIKHIEGTYLVHTIDALYPRLRRLYLQVTVSLRALAHPENLAGIAFGALEAPSRIDELPDDGDVSADVIARLDAWRDAIAAEKAALEQGWAAVHELARAIVPWNVWRDQAYYDPGDPTPARRRDAEAATVREWHEKVELASRIPEDGPGTWMFKPIPREVQVKPAGARWHARSIRWLGPPRRYREVDLPIELDAVVAPDARGGSCGLEKYARWEVVRYAPGSTAPEVVDGLLEVSGHGDGRGGHARLRAIAGDGVYEVRARVDDLPGATAIAHAFDFRSARADAELSTDTRGAVRGCVDGAEVFAAIRTELIDPDDSGDADDFLYLATWALDETTRWSVEGGQASDPEARDTVVTLLRELAWRLACKHGRFGAGEVKVLVWYNPHEASARGHGEGPGADVGDLAAFAVPWDRYAEATAAEPPDHAAIIADLRRVHRCVEADDVLRDCIDAYRRHLEPHDTTVVLFPTGVHVVTQPHPSAFSAHEQKLVLRGGAGGAGYVGGPVFLKEYWDTPEHPLRDPRRRSSADDEGADMGPMHDTGAIVRGPALDLALDSFRLRWNHAVLENSRGRWRGALDQFLRQAERHFESLVLRVKHKLYTELERRLEHTARILTTQMVTRRGHFGRAGAPDVEERAAEVRMRLSLPRVQLDPDTPFEATHILDEYHERIRELAAPGSVCYVESQYFGQHDLAWDLYQAWRAREAARGDAPPSPFAIVVVPYAPPARWLDYYLTYVIKSRTEYLKVVRRDAQCLKWLELATARRLEVFEDGAWVARCEVADPANGLELRRHGSGARVRRPVDMPPPEDWHDVVVAVDGHELPVNRVRGWSDIVVCTACVAGPVDGDAPAEGDARARAHQFLSRRGIYIHSKCAVFRVGAGDGAPLWASVGSAAFDYRSTQGSETHDGKQDSELTVFWRQGEGERSVSRLWDALWDHYGVADRDPEGFRARAWASYDAVAAGAHPDTGVMWLDVVDRYARVVG